MASSSSLSGNLSSLTSIFSALTSGNVDSVVSAASALKGLADGVKQHDSSMIKGTVYGIDNEYVIIKPKNFKSEIDFVFVGKFLFKNDEDEISVDIGDEVEVLASLKAKLGIEEIVRRLKNARTAASDKVSSVKVEATATVAEEAAGSADDAVTVNLGEALDQVLVKKLLDFEAVRTGVQSFDLGILTDRLRGHWELWQLKEEDRQGYVARNPHQDIQPKAVCLDFGTSSTVVAMRERGKPTLIRTGLKDYKSAPQARQYENPTVLEFVNLEKLRAAWESQESRPPVEWKDLKSSHTAREEAAGQASAKIINSVMHDLKGLAEYIVKDHKLLIEDQQQQTVLLGTGPEELNPIALYAYQLGLFINTQYRGGGSIHTRYYMSFPVTFTSEQRKVITDSFRLGLKRSLPEALVSSPQWKDEQLKVAEGADEPVAYAAVALKEAFLEAADHNPVAFGVFDFGGGTTDFAFGIYRYATDEESERHGWERVIDLLSVSGDLRLGGEKLLHMLAHEIVCANLDKLRSKGAGIPFLLPEGTFPPEGAEMLFTDSVTARANTRRLMEAVRPLWEEGDKAFDAEGSGVVNVMLQDLAGEEITSLSLSSDKESLKAKLKDRITAGVELFFTAFIQEFKRYLREEQQSLAAWHILLAGNSCRSPLVKEAFETKLTDIRNSLNIEDMQGIILHEPVLPDDAHPNAASLKTGVALGLLNTLPGESLGIVKARDLIDPDSYFRFHFGVIKREHLEPVLSPGFRSDSWVKLGKVRSDLTQIVAWSSSPLAGEGKLPRGEFYEDELDFAEELEGYDLYVKPQGQDKVILAVDVTEENPEGKVIRELLLKE